MVFIYLVDLIDSYRYVEATCIQDSRIAAYLKICDVANKHIRTDTETRIYKTSVRPIMACSTETRRYITKTKRIIETCQMKVITTFVGKCWWTNNEVKTLTIVFGTGILESWSWWRQDSSSGKRSKINSPCRHRLYRNLCSSITLTEFIFVGVEQQFLLYLPKSTRKCRYPYILLFIDFC